MKKIYNLEDLDCAVCAQKIEDNLRKLEGIKDVNVSFISQKIILEVEDDIDLKKLEKEIKKVIRRVEPDCSIIL